MSNSNVTPADKLKAQRLPAPTLFVGPPSRNASNISLQQPSKDGGSRLPLARQQSLLGDRRGQAAPLNPAADASSNDNAGAVFKKRQPQSSAERAAEQQSNERTDALWAEMQNTLEEVELNATSGTHVFGPGHSKALDELRTAQIALAQAWAKSEAEEEREMRGEDNADDKGVQEEPLGTADVLATDRAEKFGSSDARARKGSSKSQLEEETENDIQLARKRREANDQYFQRVNKGVLDVVAKLEEVAKAMKGVEMESREIWDDKESINSGSVG